MTRFRTPPTDIPAGPPPEVLSEIEVAWKRAGELFASDLELHIEVGGEFGRVSAELRLPDGSVAERLVGV